MYYLYEIQTTVSQTIWIPSTTLYSGMPMEFNFYGFHQKTPFLLRFRHYPSYSGLSVKISHIHPHLWYHHFSGTSTPFCYPCLFKMQSSVSCYVRPQLQVCLLLFPLSRYCPRHETSLYQWIPSGGKRSSRTDQPDVGTVFLHILQLPTRQLVWTVTSSKICLQQYS